MCSNNWSFAEETLNGFTSMFRKCWIKMMRKKLGLFGEEVEDEKLIQAETNNICDLDTDNDGICEIQTSVTLTLTTEVFSIAGSLGSISMTVSPNSFTLDSNDPNLYEIEIYAEALTPDGGVLIPPEERTIEFNFSRTPEIG